MLRGALCADGHVGYSQPIGGAVAYADHISPSGVGYDIACGNKAARTNLRADEIRADLGRIMDSIFSRISFGVGRKNEEPVDHPVLDTIKRADFAPQRQLHSLAAKQLGTVGAGNHYVDLFADEDGWVWIGVHFGSRGFGHKTASGFLALAQGLPFDGHAKDTGMDSPPVLFRTDSDLGQSYIAAMQLAGDYAYAGRDTVVAKVLEILGAECDRGGPQPSQFRLERAAFRHRRVGDPQGLHAGVPGPGGVRRRDDGRAVGDPARFGLGRVARAALFDRARRRAGDVAHAGGGQAAQGQGRQARA